MLSLSLIKSVIQDWTAGTYDVRGDGMASRYGGPEASQIPNYKRAGKGAILGLPGHMRIMAVVNSGIEVGDSWRRSAQPSDEEHICSSGSDSEDHEFKTGVEEAALTARLRDIDQRARAHPADIRAWLALADLQQQVVGIGSYRQSQGSRERGSAARRTIAEVQLSVLEKGQRAHPGNSASIVIGLARLQVAISGGLWDDAKVEAEFRRLLRSLSERGSNHSPRQAQAVWALYLSWKPTSVSATLSDVCASYAEALSSFATFGHPYAFEYCFSMQLRLCELLQRAGYSARAFAILQAQIELSLVPFSSGEEAKDKLQKHWDCEEPRIGEQGAILQASAFVGEPEKRARSVSPSVTKGGQAHWRSPFDRWVAAQRELAHLRQRPARTDDPPIYSAGEGEVDPFSVILFSDIRPFLISGLPAELRLQALRNLAQFLGLAMTDGVRNLSQVADRPVLKQIATQEWSARFWPSSLHKGWQNEKGGDVEIDSKQQTRLGNPWACPLIGIARPLSSLAFSCKDLSPPLATADLKWLTLMLAQLVTTTAEEQGAVAVLQLAIAVKTGDASILEEPMRKLTDGEDRADLARGRVFALNESSLPFSPELELGVVDAVEFHIGLDMADVALNILEKAASNGHRYVSGDEDSTVTVAEQLKARRYYSTIRDKANQDNSSASLSALVSAAWYHYLMAPPERRLAAILAFFDGIIDSVPNDYTYHLCEARLRIVWYHLSQERPVYRPDEVRRALVQSIRLFPHDLTFQALLAAHESRFRIEGVVRRTLEEYVFQPLEQVADSRLQSLASLVEDQEVEGLFALEHKAEKSWLMAIYIELHLNREVVNAHLVRSLFERALQQEVTKTSNVLWTLYLSFEVRTSTKALADLQRERQHTRNLRYRDGHLNRADAKAKARVVSLRTQQKLFTRAKAVFYRAVAACPFDRDIYLQAYEYPFRLAFSAEELRQLHSVMDDERELRVFGSIEGLLQMEEAQRGAKEVGAGEIDADTETDDEDQGSDVDQAHG
ncbi:hypothetical protein BCV69DRAFT_292369 [Microstroma glucosiphilum]|uniref:DUF1740-domain-containing protein n=1 Tax=Pseudomicrostroma glucosiphilum TaxID=1684307 RepID=A0A316UCP5_9BASI|nr:hypothetical protein BCV69DRAFT_292369 [Pseudomicrostroma glucosiphilum]PWN23000.1 hypothetical protein BCV69DRAFT_292369 [Pseudomicrostroma glucosiphilum]